MGNQSSSASASSISSSSKRKSKALLQKSKSASDFATAVRLEEAVSGADADVDADGANKSGVESEKFHYNIHQPADLLDCKPNPSLLLVKRHSTALETFVSGKSPLRDYLKDKFKRQTEPLQVVQQPPLPRMNSNIDKLAKILAQLSVPVGKITKHTLHVCTIEFHQQKNQLKHFPPFQKHFIPSSPILSNYFWSHLIRHSKVPLDSVSEGTFVVIAEKICTFHTDKDQLTFYLKLFTNDIQEMMVEREVFMDFLISCYQLAMVGEPKHDEALELKGCNPFDGKEYFESVVKSCYHIKNEMSVCFLSNWLLANLPRIHDLMHKYILHQLTTGYSQLSTGNVTINSQGSGITTINSEKRLSLDYSSENQNVAASLREARMDPILLWLLRCSLSNKYLTIFNKRVEPLAVAKAPISPQLRAITSAQLLMQLMQSKAEPGSWSLLYNSDNDGMSINRFQFHLFNYKGPSILIVSADNGYKFAIASDTEWRESCHFWGNEDAMLLQLQPEFRIVEKGSKLIYVNFSIRGYPFGIQAGKDPRNVSLDIKPDFSYANFKKIPCRIENIEAWGCAPKQAQVAQIEHKNWEAKQCENIRKVQINTAEWKENPDKYLLELAGNYKSYN